MTSFSQSVKQINSDIRAMSKLTYGNWGDVHFELLLRDEGVLDTLNAIEALVANANNSRFALESAINDKIKEKYFDGQGGKRVKLSGGSWRKLSTEWVAYKASKGWSTRILEQTGRLKGVIERNAARPPTGTNLLPDFADASHVWFHEFGAGHPPKRDFIRNAMKQAVAEYTVMLEGYTALNATLHGSSGQRNARALSMRVGIPSANGVYTPASYAKIARASSFGVARQLEATILPRNTFEMWFWLLGLLPPSGAYQYVGLFFQLWNIMDAQLLNAKALGFYGRSMALGATGYSPKIVRRLTRRGIY